jgi:hypothetical protein
MTGAQLFNANGKSHLFLKRLVRAAAHRTMVRNTSAISLLPHTRLGCHEQNRSKSWRGGQLLNLVGKSHFALSSDEPRYQTFFKGTTAYCEVAAASACCSER